MAALLSPSAGAARSATAGDPIAPEAARELARRWLEAVRDADLSTLAAISTLPLRLRGFNLPTGPARERCGGPTPKGALEGVRSFHAAGLVAEARDPAGFRSLLACVLADTMLTHTMPRQSDGGWQPKRPEAGPRARCCLGLSGELRVIAPRALARNLRRFREQAAALAAEGHTLVEARMTDNNGVTNHALVAVRPTPAGPRVAAVLVDELFEE